VAHDLMRETIARQMAAQLEQQIDKGGLIEAALRAVIYVRQPEGKIDERGFAVLKEIGAALPAAKRIGLARLKEVVREQFLILLRDEDRAIAALPKLLPENRKEREAGVAAVRRITAARGALPAEGNRRLARIEALFSLPEPAAGAERQPEMAGE